MDELSERSIRQIRSVLARGICRLVEVGVIRPLPVLYNERELTDQIDTTLTMMVGELTDLKDK